jgi:heme-degrading monooxygenase HmoA
MESLALLAIVVLFTALIGGPVAFLLTYLPDQPKRLRVSRTIAVVILSLIGLLFGFQLVIAGSVPLVPRIIGIIGVASSATALLYEFKVLKHKNLNSTKAGVGSNFSSKSTSDSVTDAGTKIVYAVIFKSKRQDANHDLYYQHNDALEEKIKSLPGYIKHSGIRHPETRQGVTIAYFNSLEAIDNWRKDSEHLDAKKLAKDNFYENYSVEITEVIDSYGWDGDSQK